MPDYDIVTAIARVEDEMIDSMIRNLSRHHLEEIVEKMNWEQWQVVMLAELEKYKRRNAKKYGTVFEDINSRIESLIRKANENGQSEQEKKILEAIKKGFKGYRDPNKGLTAQFFHVNDRKMEALINATINDMQKAETAILRMANDQFRRIIFDAQVYAATGAATYKKAVDMATKDMLAAGLNCVEYKNGARHRLDDYAEMAIRTASKRAYLSGEGVMRQKWGISLVIINKRQAACPKCAPFVGKIMIDDVWSGGSREDGEYPLMSEAVAAGLYHPRCKDAHSTYFKGISRGPGNGYTQEELEDLQEQSSQEARQQYAERQVEKYERMEKYSLDKENQSLYHAKINDDEKNEREVISVDDLSDEMKELLHNYTYGEFDDICEYSQYVISGGKGVVSKKYGKEIDASDWCKSRLPEISDKTKQKVEELIKIIDNQPVSENQLYRIEMGVSDATEGDVINFGIRSTSKDANFVERVFSGEDQGIKYHSDGNFTEYRFANNKSLDISSISEFNGDNMHKSQEECLVYGRYKVVKTEQIKNISEHIEERSIPYREYLENKGIEVELTISKKGTEIVRFVEDGAVKTFSKEQFGKKMYNEYVTIPAQYGRKVVYLELVE